jgi:hypothetical protein
VRPSSAGRGLGMGTPRVELWSDGRSLELCVSEVAEPLKEGALHSGRATQPASHYGLSIAPAKAAPSRTNCGMPRPLPMSSGTCGTVSRLATAHAPGGQ